MLNVYFLLTPSCPGAMSTSSPRRYSEASPRQFRGVYEKLLVVCFVAYVTGFPVLREKDSPGADFDENNPIAVAGRNNKSIHCLSFLSVAWRAGEASCRDVEKAGKDCSPGFDSSPCSDEEWRTGGEGGRRFFDKEGKESKKKPEQKQKQKIDAKPKVRGDVGPPANIDYVMPTWFRLRPDDTSAPDDISAQGEDGFAIYEEVFKQMSFNETAPSLHFNIKMENTLRLKNEFEDRAELENEDGLEGGEVRMGVKRGEESGGDDDALDIAIFVYVVLASVLLSCGLAAGCFFLIHLAIKINTAKGPVNSLSTSISSSTVSSSPVSSSTVSSSPASRSTVSATSTSIMDSGDDDEESAGAPDRRQHLSFNDGGFDDGGFGGGVFDDGGVDDGGFDGGAVGPDAESSRRPQDEDDTVPQAEFHRDENTQDRENSEEREVHFDIKNVERKAGG